MHFTESTEPSPQKSQSGQGVWLRDLGSGLCALWEKDFLQKSVIDAGKGRPLFGDVRGIFKIRYQIGPIIKPGDRSDLPPYAAVAVFRSEVAERGSPAGLTVASPAEALSPFGGSRVFISSPYPENTPGREHLISRVVCWAGGVDGPPRLIYRFSGKMREAWALSRSWPARLLREWRQPTCSVMALRWRAFSAARAGFQHPFGWVN